jgi:expansin (peptidoglycan-binding protein)
MFFLYTTDDTLPTDSGAAPKAGFCFFISISGGVLLFPPITHADARLRAHAHATLSLAHIRAAAAGVLLIIGYPPTADFDFETSTIFLYYISLLSLD